jgi:TRAP-type uncharacterized transport system substrate-binding protein
MRNWRRAGVATVAAVALVLAFVALLEFLAPSLAYQLRDRVAETASGRRGRTYRIALGSAIGSSFHIGSVLDQHLAARAGYHLELVRTVAPGNVKVLLDPHERIDLAVVSSVDDDALRSTGVYGIAALEPQHFFVIVPNDSLVREVRDLAGPVNPGVRDAGHPPTLGERVLDYYGLLTAAPAAAAPVTVVRPRHGNLEDFEAGHMVAATRTQFLRSPLVEAILQTGRYRLVPVRDHEALARSIAGARPGFIPAGLYGPGRRIPSEAVPTITVTQLLVARSDVPGRVVRDILECLYDPRFARDAQYAFTESSGRDVGGLPLHPAAAIFYRRNDLVTSDRLGRLSFVGSVLVALFTLAQFAVRVRRRDSARARRRRLCDELEALEALRLRIASSTVADERLALVREADDLLSRAERHAAAGLWERDDVLAMRSLHATCSRSSGGGRPSTTVPPPVPDVALTKRAHSR